LRLEEIASLPLRPQGRNSGQLPTAAAGAVGLETAINAFLVGRRL